MEYILSKLLIFSWTDCVEILFFTTVVYTFTTWLHKDKSKNMVLWFYGYASLLTATHFFELANANKFLIAVFPVAIMLFLLLHQRELQKNFVSLKNVNIKVKNLDWIDIILRSAITAMDSNKNFLCLIEGKDALNGFITSSLIAESEITENLLDIFIKSPVFDQDKIIWISNGKLLAINAEWNIENKKIWVAEKSDLEEWKQNAILFSSKTDAIIFKAYPDKRTFDIIAQGKLTEQVNTNNALNIISQYLRKNYSNIYRKNYENKPDHTKQTNA